MITHWHEDKRLFAKGWAYEHWQSTPGWHFHQFIVVNRNKGDGEGQTQFTADLPKTFFSGEHFSGKFSQFFLLYLHIGVLHMYGLGYICLETITYVSFNFNHYIWILYSHKNSDKCDSKIILQVYASLICGQSLLLIIFQ